MLKLNLINLDKPHLKDYQT